MPYYAGSLHEYLPPEAFPYGPLGPDPSQEELRLYIKDFFIFRTPLWFYVVAGITSGLLVLIMGVIALLPIKRLLEGSLWIVRFDKGVIVPNTLYAFMAVEAAYLVGFVAYLFLTWGVYLKQTLGPTAFGYFHALLWVPFWGGGWVATWGTLWAIPRDVLPVGRDSWSNSRWASYVYNLIFVGVPALVLAPILWSSIMWIIDWTRVTDEWENWDAALRLVPDRSALASPELIAEAVTIWQHQAHAWWRMGMTWWIWCGVAIIQFVSYGVIGGVLIRSIRKHLHEHLALADKNGNAHRLTTDVSSGEAKRGQHFFPPLKQRPLPKPKTRSQELKQAVRNLQIHYAAIQTMTLLAIAIVALEASTVQKRARLGPGPLAIFCHASITALSVGTIAAAIMILLAICFRELGEPVVFFWRSLRAHSSGHPTETDISGGLASRDSHAPSFKGWRGRIKSPAFRSNAPNVGLATSFFETKTVGAEGAIRFTQDSGPSIRNASRAGRRIPAPSSSNVGVASTFFESSDTGRPASQGRVPVDGDANAPRSTVPPGSQPQQHLVITKRRSSLASGVKHGDANSDTGSSSTQELVIGGAPSLRNQRSDAESLASFRYLAQHRGGVASTDSAYWNSLMASSTPARRGSSATPHHDIEMAPDASEVLSRDATVGPSTGHRQPGPFIETGDIAEVETEGSPRSPVRRLQEEPLASSTGAASPRSNGGSSDEPRRTGGPYVTTFGRTDFGWVP